MINPSSKIKFVCYGQSFMRSAGEIVSVVLTRWMEVCIICYNQAEDTITTIHNYGYYN